MSTEVQSSEVQPTAAASVPAIPPAIAAGIVQVQSQVKRLAKESENKFAEYMYASADAFFAAVGPLEAEAGLFTLMEEGTVEIVPMAKPSRESSNWLRVCWQITVGHRSGATYGPLHRTVMVPANGAQAFGSAQTYALKQFMRGLYKIPTGDKDDADSQPAEPLPAADKPQQQAAAPAGKKAAGKPAGKPAGKAAAKPGADAAEFARAVDAITNCTDIAKLHDIKVRVDKRFSGQEKLIRELTRLIGEQLETAILAAGKDQPATVLDRLLYTTKQSQLLTAEQKANIESTFLPVLNKGIEPPPAQQQAV
jgi:hypothetical protein